MEERTSIREEFRSFKLIKYEFFNAVLLSIPDFLQEISDEEKKLKLSPALTENVWVASNEKHDIFFQISQLVDIGAQTDLKALFKQMKAQIGTITAGFQLFGSGTKMVNDIEVACMNYKYTSLGGNKYVIMFLFLSERKCFLGNFIAPFDCQEECTSAFLMLINTLHIKT